MFCPKCGNKLPDSAKFCNVCGNPTGENGANAPGVNAPPPPKPAIPFQLPTLTEKLVLAFTTVMFIFLFFGWFRQTGWLGTYTFFDGDLFNVNALFGLCMIAAILNVLVFSGYVFFSYVDINKTGYGVSSAFLKKLCATAFYALYLFCVLFCLIGVATEEGLSVSIVWFFAFIGGGLGFTMTLFPNLVKKFIKK